MAKKFYTPIDLQQFELQNSRVQNLGAPPGSPVRGQIFYHSGTDQFGYWNGTTWVYGSTVPDASTSVKGIVQLTNDLSGTATAPVVNHFTLTTDASANTHKITGLVDPTNPQEAATKNYVDTAAPPSLIGDYKQSVRAVAITNGVLASAYANGQTVDGYTLVTGDRILLTAQTTVAENGIYTVNASGAPTRAADAASGTLLTLGATVTVEAGTSYIGTVWRYISGAFTAQAWTATIQLGGNIVQNSIGGSGSTLNLLTQNTVHFGFNFGDAYLNGTGFGPNGRTTPAAAIDLASATSVAGGIAFGAAEFTLYRSAANILTLGGSGAALTTLTVDPVTGSGDARIKLTGRNAGVAKYWDQQIDGGTGDLTFVPTSLVQALHLKTDSLYVGEGSTAPQLSISSGNIGPNTTPILAMTNWTSGVGKTISFQAGSGGSLSIFTGGAGANINLANTPKITGLADPTLAQDAATKNYVDNIALSGVSWKAPVLVATTGAESYTVAGGACTQIAGTTVDGQAPGVGDRILIKNAPATTGAGVGSGALGISAQPGNGIYVVTNATTNLTVTRSADADTTAEIMQATVMVEKGTNMDSLWTMTADPGFVLNTNVVLWASIQSGTAIGGDGVYITRSGNNIQPVAVPADPTAGANGTVVATAPALSRVVRFAIKGDGSTTVYTCTHNLSNRAVWAIGFQDSAGAPAAPVEIDYASSSTSAIAVTFPTAPTAGQIFYVEVVG